jgi:hypothetical protein
MYEKDKIEILAAIFLQTMCQKYKEKIGEVQPSYLNEWAKQAVREAEKALEEVQMHS